MASVRNKHTRPELRVRSLLHRLGYRFRLHRKDLPGKPDIVLPKYRTAIFVHGCFWHGHENCKRGALPETNRDFWRAKIEKNRQRDESVQHELRRLGWKAIIVWECEVGTEELPGRLESRVKGDNAEKERRQG